MGANKPLGRRSQPGGVAPHQLPALGAFDPHLEHAEVEGGGAAVGGDVDDFQGALHQRGIAVHAYARFPELDGLRVGKRLQDIGLGLGAAIGVAVEEVGMKVVRRPVWTVSHLPVACSCRPKW